MVDSKNSVNHKYNPIYPIFLVNFYHLLAIVLLLSFLPSSRVSLLLIEHNILILFVNRFCFSKTLSNCVTFQGIIIIITKQTISSFLSKNVTLLLFLVKVCFRCTFSDSIFVFVANTVFTFIFFRLRQTKVFGFFVFPFFAAKVLTFIVILN